MKLPIGKALTLYTDLNTAEKLSIRADLQRVHASLVRLKQLMLQHGPTIATMQVDTQKLHQVFVVLAHQYELLQADMFVVTADVVKRLIASFVQLFSQLEKALKQ